jgi:hypothetical protein
MVARAIAIVAATSGLTSTPKAPATPTTTAAVTPPSSAPRAFATFFIADPFGWLARVRISPRLATVSPGAGEAKESWKYLPWCIDRCTDTGYAEDMTAVRYKGVRRDATPMTGTIDLTDLASFTKTRYEWGWRWLEATLDGRIVARIEDDGVRRWWAETDA